MRRWLRIAAVSPLLCLAARAAAGGELVTYDEWVSLTEGRTVHYAVDGEDAGREYYPAGGGFVVFVAPDGSCYEGPWAHSDGRFCFWYGPDLQCFYHKRRDGALISQPDSGGKIQVVTRIADGEPLYCAPG